MTLNLKRRNQSLWWSTIGVSCLVLACFQSAPPTPSTSDHRPLTPPGAVLFVLSAASEQVLRNGTTRKTGYFLGEFYEPFQALERAGYQVQVATPGGRRPVVDPESLNDNYWEQPGDIASALEIVDSDARFLRPMSIEKALEQASVFQGLIVPGGQGVMVDLLDNRALHDLVAEISTAGGSIGLICHAPAILTRLANGGGSLAGRRVTSVSSLEEFYIERFVMSGKARVRSIGELLDNTGFDHGAAFPKADHAVRDCNLVTSQNPFSGASFNLEYLQALESSRSGAIC